VLEAGSSDTGMAREHRVREMSAAESRYQATASGDCNILRTLVCV
jgi:hypothetical protein